MFLSPNTRNLFIYLSKDPTWQNSEPAVSGIMPAVFFLIGSSMIFCQFIFRNTRYSRLSLSRIRWDHGKHSSQP
jgi:hypothetical protein